jgi:hypothetical protein
MPTVDRRRPSLARVGIGVAAVGVIAVVIVAGQVARPAKVSPNGGSGAPSGISDGPVGPRPVVADAFPAIDPVPWTAIDWRRVPNAFGKKVDPVLNRIDGLIPGGPGLIGWGRTSQPGAISSTTWALSTCRPTVPAGQSYRSTRVSGDATRRRSISSHRGRPDS